VYSDPKEADMPNGIFPVPPFDSRPSHTTDVRPSLAVRIRTWLRRNHLDEELAHGADPDTTAELNRRATQLRSPAEHSRLANAFTETLGDARRGTPVTIRAQPQRAEVRAAADDLQALMARLRDGRPISVRGAAMAARLLSDRTGPLYRDGGQDLQHAIRAARFALDVAGMLERRAKRARPQIPLDTGRFPLVSAPIRNLGAGGQPASPDQCSDPDADVTASPSARRATTAPTRSASPAPGR
jgi:hypothetical protein